MIGRSLVYRDPLEAIRPFQTKISNDRCDFSSFPRIRFIHEQHEQIPDMSHDGITMSG